MSTPGVPRRHAAIFLLLVVISVAVPGGLGCRSTSDIEQGADKSVCDVVAHSLNDKTGPFSRKLDFVGKVHEHPERDPSTSICYTGAKTCCSIGLQASLAQAARKDFMTSFHAFLSSGSPSCANAESNYYTVKDGIKTHLEQFVTYTKDELRKSLCTDKTLKYSLKVLDQKFEKADMLEYLNYVKEHIFRLLFNVMIDHLQDVISNEIEYACVRHYFEQIGSEYIESTTKPLIVYFGKLYLLKKLSQHVATQYSFILQEDLTDSCVKELTRMQFCPSCSGHVCVRTCRGYCYDTVAHCVSRIRVREIQKVGQAIEQLWSDVASSTILSNLPKNIVRKFIPFLDSRSAEIRNKLNQCRIWKTSHPKNDVPCNAHYGRVAADFRNLTESLSAVSPGALASCASGLDDAVGSLPEQMCKLDHYVGSYWVGWPCWTGSYIGRYFSPREKELKSPTQSEDDLLWNLTALNSCSVSSDCIEVYNSVASSDLTFPSFLSTPSSVSPPDLDPLLRNRILKPTKQLLQQTFSQNKVPVMVLPFSSSTPSDQNSKDL